MISHLKLYCTGNQILGNINMWKLLVVPMLFLAASTAVAREAEETGLKMGFAAVDVTPDVNGPRPVWMAGQESNRRATDVHDSLYARALVLQHNDQQVALVAVDSIGVQHPLVLKVRERLPEVDYCLVASTHTHEGPDCIGIWGPSPSTSGVDPEYLQQLEEGIVTAVEEARQGLTPVSVEYGQANEKKLLRDFRLPVVLDPVLRVLRFRGVNDDKDRAILVQWNSHPVEPDGNHAISRDWIGMTVDQLEKQYDCPVIYFSGAVGGLMGTPDDLFLDEEGKQRAKTYYEFMEMYAGAVTELANRALDDASSIELTPLHVSTKPLALPLDNPGFRAARAGGVLNRPAYAWKDDAHQFGPELPESDVESDQALQSEVAYLQLGDLHVAAIPGELYPEMVYGEVAATAEAEADFPQAAVEPNIADTLPGERMLVFGLANDAIGYLVPQRQWDVEPPFCYGRSSAQYGERNSLGPRTATFVMQALVDRVDDAEKSEKAE